MLPTVNETTIQAIKDTLDRENIDYITRLSEECVEEQPDLYIAMRELAACLQNALTNGITDDEDEEDGEDGEYKEREFVDIPEPIMNLIINNVLAASLVTWKALKIQHESDELNA